MFEMKYVPRKGNQTAEWWLQAIEELLLTGKNSQYTTEELFVSVEVDPHDGQLAIFMGPENTLPRRK